MGRCRGTVRPRDGLTLILLSRFFAPPNLRSRVTTLPGFLERRFSRPCRDVVSVVSLLRCLPVAAVLAQFLKTWVRQMADASHAVGLPLVYHGCGNVTAIFEDYMEKGIDAYNPLEAKAGFDAVDAVPMVSPLEWLRHACGAILAQGETGVCRGVLE